MHGKNGPYTVRNNKGHPLSSAELYHGHCSSLKNKILTGIILMPLEKSCFKDRTVQ